MKKQFLSASNAAFLLAFFFLLCVSTSLAHAQTLPPPKSVAPAPPILLGTAWYPEAWPESNWPADLDLMQKAHVHFVRVGEFAWSRMEPSEGDYQCQRVDG